MQKPVKRELMGDRSPQQAKASRDHSHNGRTNNSKSSSSKRSSGGSKDEVHGEVRRKSGYSDVKPEEVLEKRKAGQKYPTPTPGQADRVFYETLLEQKPESHMAQDWCLAYGVCNEEAAQALYGRVCRRKGIQPSKNRQPPLSSSPIKKAPRTSGSRRAGSGLQKELDADTGFEPSGVFEGVGTTGF